MRIVTFALLMWMGASASAATMYISDNLNVPLRRGPSGSHRIINAALPSGTRLEVLGEDAESGFSEVRTPNGATGWVPTQYLTAQPVARDRLAAANQRIQALQAELESVRQDFKETRAARTEAESRNTALDQKTHDLQVELKEIRRASASAIAQYEENQQLKTENHNLHAQMLELSSTIGQLQRNTRLRWLLGGGALVLLGLACGAWIKSRPRRSSWA